MNQNDMNQNENIFYQENAVENVVSKMVAILSRPQCVNVSCSCDPYMRR